MTRFLSRGGYCRRDGYVSHEEARNGPTVVVGPRMNRDTAVGLYFRPVITSDLMVWCVFAVSCIDYQDGDMKTGGILVFSHNCFSDVSSTTSTRKHMSLSASIS